MITAWLRAAALAGVGLSAPALALRIAPQQGDEYLAIVRRWSDPRAWPGHVVPVAGDCVTIPRGKNFVLDVSPPPLAGLDIAGSLIFDDVADLELQSDWIRVTGSLDIGSEANPHEHRATITLTENFGSECVAGTTKRTLAVEGEGQLGLHGRPRVKSWTRLAATTATGETQLVLTDAVDWEPGDAIVIAPTDFHMHDDVDQRTLVSVQGNVIEIDQPLSVTRWSALEGASYDGVGVEERAEVGLLSHNVVVQGVPFELETGKIAAGQTRFHEAGAHAPRAQIEWSEFRFLGDEEVLGHYPIHFHQIGDVSGSYVRNSSIHHCFNRWLSIHTSQGLVVEDNVAFETIGHGFYFEDNGARGCTMRRNLGLTTRPVSHGSGLNQDDRPSIFWLYHPDNVVEDNVAVSSDFAGFWFETEDNEIAPWSRFSGNVAHSNGDSGFYANNKPTPSPASELSHCLAYKNRRYGYWLRSLENLTLTDCDSADNRGGYYLAAAGFQVDALNRDGISRIRLVDSLVIGETANNASFAQQGPNATCLGYPRWDALAGVELYDGLVEVERSTFASFDDRIAPNGLVRKAGAFTPTWYASPWAVDPRNLAVDCTFINDGITVTNPLWLRQPSGVFVKCNGVLKADNGVANTILFDANGSFSGIAGAYIVPNNPFLMPTTPGSFVPAWNAWVIDGPPSNAYGQLDFNTIAPDALVAQLALQGFTLPDVISKLVTISAPARGVAFTMAAPKETQNQTPGAFQPRYPTCVLANDLYEYTYDPLVSTSTWGRWFQLTFQDARPDDYVVVSVPILEPSANGLFLVDINGADVSASPEADLAGVLASGANAWWYDAPATRVWLRLKLDALNGGTTIYDSASTTVTVLSY